MESFAYGVLEMSPDEFGRLTPGELKAKIKGFNDHYYQTIWFSGLMVGKAMGASDKYPYPSFLDFVNQLKGEETREETDKELFELAQEKGIVIPEGVV